MEAKLVPPEYLPQISPDKMKSLEDYFRSNRNATSIDLDILAMELNLHEDDVRVRIFITFPWLLNTLTYIWSTLFQFVCVCAGGGGDVDNMKFLDVSPIYTSFTGLVGSSLGNLA